MIQRTIFFLTSSNVMSCRPDRLLHSSMKRLNPAPGHQDRICRSMAAAPGKSVSDSFLNACSASETN